MFLDRKSSKKGRQEISGGKRIIMEQMATKVGYWIKMKQRRSKEATQLSCGVAVLSSMSATLGLSAGYETMKTQPLEPRHYLKTLT